MPSILSSELVIGLTYIGFDFGHTHMETRLLRRRLLEIGFIDGPSSFERHSEGFRAVGV